MAIPSILSLDSKIRAGDAVQIVSGKGELVCFAKRPMDADDIVKREKGIAFDIEWVVRSFTAFTRRRQLKTSFA